MPHSKFKSIAKTALAIAAIALPVALIQSLRAEEPKDRIEVVNTHTISIDDTQISELTKSQSLRKWLVEHIESAALSGGDGSKKPAIVININVFLDPANFDLPKYTDI